MELKGQRNSCQQCGAAMSHDAEGHFCSRCLLATALRVMTDDRPPADELESPARLLEGREFGDYELIEQLGRGGMGVVFKARQKRTDRLVALKVIAAGELASPKTVARFQLEAKAVARLHHPNIIQIFEVGEHHGWHFFSMQLVEGPTLAEVNAAFNAGSNNGGGVLGNGSRELNDLFAGAKGIRNVVHLIAQVARAVHHAHQRGILHRDIKPTNILLNGEGEPYLTDFGLARGIEKESSLTFSRAVVGTPAYMSPEQATGQGEPLTVGADVYGLGGLLYEALAGRPPFAAESTAALIRKISDEDAPPPSKAAEAARENKLARRRGGGRIARDLDVICLKCLEKSPALRYASAADLADDLDRWLRGEPIQARPSGAWERTRKWVVRNQARAGLIATVAVAVAVITAGSLWFNVHLNRARIAAEQGAQTSLNRLVRAHSHESSALARRGDGLAGMHSLVEALGLVEGHAVAESRLRRRIGLINSYSPRPIRVWDAGGVPSRLRFSVDGRRLLVAVTSGRTQIMSLSTGERLGFPGRSESEAIILDSRFSNDGNLVLQLLDRPPFAQIWDVEQGEARALALSESCGAAGAISSDGRWIATGGAQIRLWDAETRAAAPVEFDYPVKCLWLGFSPDNRRLLTVHDGETVILWDTESGKVVGEPFVAIGTPGWSQPRFSGDGTLIFVANDGVAEVRDVETFALQGEAPHSGVLFQGEFDPAGEALATASFHGHGRIWDLEDFTLQAPTFSHESGASCIAFSPDGGSIATGGFDYQVRLWRRKTHHQIAPTLHHTALITSMAFSPDGRFLATGAASGTVRLWALGDEPRRLLFRGFPSSVERPDTPMVVRPDGLAFAVAEGSGSWRLFRMTENSAEPTVSLPVNHDALVEWDDRRNQIVTAEGDGLLRLWDAEGGRETGRFQIEGEAQCLAFSPDGQALLVGTSDGRAKVISMADGHEVFPPLEQDGGVKLAEWSPDGQHLVTSERGKLHVWSAVTGEKIASPEDRDGEVGALRFSEDGGFLAACYFDEAIEPQAAVLTQFEAPFTNRVHLVHGDGVRDAVFSPDLSRVVTAGEDNTARLWDLESGLPAAPAMRHRSMVRCVTFSPDGRYVATGGNDDSLRFWETASGELMGPPVEFGSPVRKVMFTPNGKRVIARLSDHTLWAVDFPIDERSTMTLERVAALATGHRLDATGGLIPVSAAEMEREFRALQEEDPSAGASGKPASEWHAQQAELAEHDGKWFGAVFHLERLIRFAPQDFSLVARLEEARRRLAEERLAARTED